MLTLWQNQTALAQVPEETVVQKQPSLLPSCLIVFSFGQHESCNRTYGRTIYLRWIFEMVLLSAFFNWIGNYSCIMGCGNNNPVGLPLVIFLLLLFWCHITSDIDKALTSTLKYAEVKWEVFTAVLMKMQFFWDVTLCRLINSYQQWMKALQSLETLVIICQSTWHNITEGWNFQMYRTLYYVSTCLLSSHNGRTVPHCHYIISAFI
jgi:hypothetical protein